MMADVCLRKIKAGKVNYTNDLRNVVDLLFNEDVLKRIKENRHLKENDILLSLAWRNGDGDDIRKVFSSITFIQCETVSNTTDFNKILAKAIVTNNEVSRQLVVDLFQVFQARLMLMTLVPISFVLCHKTTDDFKQLAQDSSQLKGIFRQLVSRVNCVGKVEMKLRLLRGAPVNLPSHALLKEVPALRKPGSQFHRFRDLDAAMEQRFTTIESEIQTQEELMSQQLQKRKQFNDEIHEMLNMLIQILPSSSETKTEEMSSSDLRMQRRKAMSDKFQTESQKNTSDISKVVNKCNHFNHDSGNTDTNARHQENDQSQDKMSVKTAEPDKCEIHSPAEDRSTDTLHKGTNLSVRSNNEQSQKGPGMFSPQSGMSSPEVTGNNSCFKRPLVPLKRKVSMSADRESYKSVADNTIYPTSHSDTSGETRNVSFSPAKIKFMPEHKTRPEGKMFRTFQSFAYLYPQTRTKNKRKEFESVHRQVGLCRLDYSCTLYDVCTTEGERIIHRRSDYTLTDGEREEKWSKVDEYGAWDNAPNLLDCLPYDLVPVPKHVDYTPPGPSEVTFGSPSDIEKLLIRLDIGIIKEKHHELENQHAAKSTLDNLREILGKREPVWDLADSALREVTELVEVHTCPTAMDTILCLDNCGTMSRAAYLKLKEIAKTFISGIETVADVYGLEENIAIVTLGSGAKIDHHLSIDYDSLKNTVEQIECGGTSSKSYLEGILVCLAAVTKGGVTNFGQYLRVPARLIFVTDGITVGKTGQCKSANERNKVLRAIQELGSEFVLKNVFNPIVVVPHGLEDKSFLESMVKHCKGTLVEDVSSLCDHQRIQMQSAQIIRFVESHCGFERKSAMKLDGIINTLTKGFRSASKKKIKDIVEERLYQNENSKLDSACDFGNINEEEGLPPLGSRVVRGPDWKWANEDTECAGTVINHHYDKQHLYVCWDNGVVYEYRYGVNGYDVLAVDDRPVVPQEDILIKIGMQVERGPDWHDSYCDQDGGPGSRGTVIRLGSGRVMVRWKNGGTYSYRFGENGRYDLTLHNPMALPPEPTKEAQSKSLSDKCETDHVDQGLEKPQTSEQLNSAEVWQWLGEDGTWVTYSEDINAKLTKAYSKRPQGSCLIEKDGKSFRVSFRISTEKSIAEKKDTPVRKYMV